MQCSNSNTTTISLAATPLCMVANIALDLSFGDVIFPQIFPMSLSVLINIANISHTIVSATFVDGRTQANRLILPPRICLDIFSIWCTAVIFLLILKQMDVNQTLPRREHKMQSACLFLPWGGYE